jgi:hypothetical protein
LVRGKVDAARAIEDLDEERHLVRNPQATEAATNLEAGRGGSRRGQA